MIGLIALLIAFVVIAKLDERHHASNTGKTDENYQRGAGDRTEGYRHR